MPKAKLYAARFAENTNKNLKVEFKAILKLIYPPKMQLPNLKLFRSNIYNAIQKVSWYSASQKIVIFLLYGVGGLENATGRL